MADTSTGDDHVYVVVGLTSFGPNGCLESGLPGVYTRVTDFYDWIVSSDMHY